MKTLRYVLCDVFTDRPLSGNQLAVFTDATGVAPEVMQALAREMGFSESVFVLRAERGGHARIRIFTPTAELPFAGHPTLGAAFVLGQPMQLEELRIETGAGVIPVRLEREGARVVFGRMAQPLPTSSAVEDVGEVLAALGVERSELPVERYDLGVQHLFVALPSREEVAALVPDFAALKRLGDVGVNVFSGDGLHYRNRMFAAGHAIEDAATGSAAGPLAVHLCRHGRLSYGDEIEIEQGAEIGRPSRLYACVHGATERLERVEVGGCAVTVAHGEFRALRSQDLLP